MNKEKVIEIHKHKIDDISTENLEHQTAQLKQFEQLLEVEKMVRKST